MGHNWYVTFQVQKRGTLPKARHPRLTKTFETECEAKDFARAKFHQGLTVTAGTINPFSPKQIVPPSAIANWLDAGQGKGGEESREVDRTSFVEQRPPAKDCP